MFMFQSICVLFWGGSMVAGVLTGVTLHLQSGNREGECLCSGCLHNPGSQPRD